MWAGTALPGLVLGHRAAHTPLLPAMGLEGPGWQWALRLERWWGLGRGYAGFGMVHRRDGVLQALCPMGVLGRGTGWCVWFLLTPPVPEESN